MTWMVSRKYLPHYPHRPDVEFWIERTLVSRWRFAIAAFWSCDRRMLLALIDRPTL